MIERIESVPRLRGKLVMEDGKTPSGNSYRYFSGLDRTADGGRSMRRIPLSGRRGPKCSSRSVLRGCPKCFPPLARKRKCILWSKRPGQFVCRWSRRGRVEARRVSEDTGEEWKLSSLTRHGLPGCGDPSARLRRIPHPPILRDWILSPRPTLPIMSSDPSSPEQICLSRPRPWRMPRYPARRLPRAGRLDCPQDIDEPGEKQARRMCPVGQPRREGGPPGRGLGGGVADVEARPYRGGRGRGHPPHQPAGDESAVPVAKNPTGRSTKAGLRGNRTSAPSKRAKLSDDLEPSCKPLSGECRSTHCRWRRSEEECHRAQADTRMRGQVMGITTTFIRFARRTEPKACLHSGSSSSRRPRDMIEVMISGRSREEA